MSEESDADGSTDGTDSTGDIDSGDLRLAQGRQFHYEDGVVEAVVAAEGDRVLTVREYPAREQFRAVADRAVSVDTNEELADIDAESVLAGDTADPSASAGAAVSGTENVAPAGTRAPDEDGDETDGSEE